MSREAHKLCFNEDRPIELNTCDYALLVVNERNHPIAYSTVIEIDKNSAYMQHGGSFPEFAGTIKVARAYHLMIAFIKENYKRITTRIQNTNMAMLKLAMSAGLLVNGIDFISGDIFLNLFYLKGD